MPVSTKKYSQLLGAHRIGLVGRDRLLDYLVKTYKTASRPTLVYLEGGGGIGKTAIMREVQSIAKEMENEKRRIYLVGANIIDLFYIEFDEYDTIRMFFLNFLNK